MAEHDILIIGGGVVGMTVLQHLTTKTKLAAPPLLVEASDDLLSQASGHNSGIACTGEEWRGVFLRDVDVKRRCFRM